jgi:hypothetical protein
MRPSPIRQVRKQTPFAIESEQSEKKRRLQSNKFKNTAVRHQTSPEMRKHRELPGGAWRAAAGGNLAGFIREFREN